MIATNCQEITQYIEDIKPKAARLKECINTDVNEALSIRKEIETSGTYEALAPYIKLHKLEQGIDQLTSIYTKLESHLAIVDLKILLELNPSDNYKKAEAITELSNGRSSGLDIFISSLLKHHRYEETSINFNKLQEPTDDYIYQLVKMLLDDGEYDIAAQYLNKIANDSLKSVLEIYKINKIYSANNTSEIDKDSLIPELYNLVGRINKDPNLYYDNNIIENAINLVISTKGIDEATEFAGSVLEPACEKIYLAMGKYYFKEDKQELAEVFINKIVTNENLKMRGDLERSKYLYQKGDASSLDAWVDSYKFSFNENIKASDRRLILNAILESRYSEGLTKIVSETLKQGKITIAVLWIHIAESPETQNDNKDSYLNEAVKALKNEQISLNDFDYINLYREIAELKAKYGFEYESVLNIARNICRYNQKLNPDALGRNYQTKLREDIEVSAIKCYTNSLEAQK